MSRVEALYPETLREHNIGGTVRLRVTIAANGSVEDVEVLGGNPILGESAANAVKRWSCAPSRAASTEDVLVPFDATK